MIFLSSTRRNPPSSVAARFVGLYHIVHRAERVSRRLAFGAYINEQEDYKPANFSSISACE